ncbi:hypothetical protein BDV96DRAFT_12945 [Lophiotrema nucula]|uniref:Uncharacterized protein n=1 Tax=Lophiotrema nucula TaxID=690887 RepID=A0A6A5ZU14_9PLEO|nr:hypothetical protein BDV96DRAFT_12945 [Lophiotrema nucula]
MASEGSATPTRLQMALAIAIIKSKPEGVTIRDYICQMRDHLRQGRQPTHEEDGHLYLDAVGYWKEQYAREYEVRQRAEMRVAKLERSVELLQMRVDLEAAEETGTLKRKRGGGKQASTRTKVLQDSLGPLNLSPQNSVAIKPVEADMPDDSAEDKLTHSLYVNQRLLQQPTPKTEAICFNLIQIIRAIGSVLSATFKHEHQDLQKYKRGFTTAGKGASELTNAVMSCSRAFTSVIVGLGKIAGKDFENRLTGPVVFESVKLFKNVIDIISDAARLTASTQLAELERSQKARDKVLNTIKDRDASRQLSRFVNSIVEYLDKTNHASREIFEGYLFVLLERVGKLLYYSYFGKYKSAAISGDLALPPAQDHPDVIARQKKETLAIRFEVEGLMSMLNRAIELAPYHLNPQAEVSSTSSRTSKAVKLARSLTQKAQPKASKVPLSTHAKDRLQRTLIKCMWNEKEEDELSNVLRMPARLAAMPPVPKLEEKNVDEWFQEKVWRLVGLDLLESKIQW